MNQGFQKNPQYSLPVPIARHLESNSPLPPLGPLLRRCLGRHSLQLQHVWKDATAPLGQSSRRTPTTVIILIVPITIRMMTVVK